MLPSIGTDILAIIALLFTINMAKRHIIENNDRNGNYISVSTITIVLLLLEIATILFPFSNSSDLVIPYRIANILGFSVSPLVPYIIYLFSFTKMGKPLLKRILDMPLFINALICLISYRTGWVFYVNSQNQYSRGPLFLLPTIVGVFYFLLIVLFAIKNYEEYEIDDRKVYVVIILIPLIATLFQITFKELIILWPSVALSLILYYVFLREIQYTFDAQTGVKNRKAFEKEMDKYATSNNNVLICVFDLNNLKETNDLYGHKVGDDLIIYGAKIIKETFLGIGKTYRIGGDEFCVICEDAIMQSVEKALSNLDEFLLNRNIDRLEKLIFAYGYAFYNKNGDKSIYTVFSQADSAMYAHKAKLKELHI